MRHIPLLIICSVIGVFLWKSFDLSTYQSYHSSSASQTNTMPEKQTFLEDVTVIESPQKETWLLDAIHGANKEIKIAVYMFTIPSLMDALLQAKKRGVEVKILLEKNPYNATTINRPAVQFFQNNNLDFYETNDQYFSFMHAKYIIIDDTWIIATANWTRSSFSTNREFFMLGKDPVVLNSLKKLFESDFRGVVGLVDDTRVLAGPTNARERLIKFMNSSDKKMQIYMPSITDEETILEIQKECSKGKSISILLNESKENKQEGVKIRQNGCPDIRMMKKPSLHAKAIIIDDITGFVGSFNFTKNSLENNRELGIFIEGETIGEIVNIFRQDWQKSIAF